MKKDAEFEKMDGSKLKIAIVVSRWNSEITDALSERCKQALLDSGVLKDNIIEHQVPGSYELPLAAKIIIDKEAVDAVVCLGCVIKGQTMHFEYIAEAVSQGIMKLNLESKKPVIFGVLTCLTEEQAKVRSIGENSHAYEWGLSAVEMALLKKK